MAVLGVKSLRSCSPQDLRSPDQLQRRSLLVRSGPASETPLSFHTRRQILQTPTTRKLLTNTSCSASFAGRHEDLGCHLVDRNFCLRQGFWGAMLSWSQLIF